MIRITRVDENRMQLRTIGRAILGPAHPFAMARLVVQADARCPSLAAVLAAKEPVRGGTGVPHAGLARMTRGEPEDVIHCTRGLRRIHLCESRRPPRLLPGAPEIP